MIQWYDIAMVGYKQYRVASNRPYFSGSKVFDSTDNAWKHAKKLAQQTALRRGKKAKHVIQDRHPRVSWAIVREDTVIESVGHGKIWVENIPAGYRVREVEFESVKQYININYVWKKLFDMLRHYERELGAIYVDGKLWTC